jgi:hypothetical protein
MNIVLFRNNSIRNLKFILKKILQNGEKDEFDDSCKYIYEYGKIEYERHFPIYILINSLSGTTELRTQDLINESINESLTDTLIIPLYEKKQADYKGIGFFIKNNDDIFVFNIKPDKQIDDITKFDTSFNLMINCQKEETGKQETGGNNYKKYNSLIFNKTKKNKHKLKNKTQNIHNT